MKYTFRLLFAAVFGIAMVFLWSTVFSGILGSAGVGVGICFGVAFAGCGFLFGYAIDKRRDKKNKDE